MSTEVLSDIEQAKVNRIVEALRLATGELVFRAFCEAPTPHLQEMAKMIAVILKHRESDRSYLEESSNAIAMKMREI